MHHVSASERVSGQPRPQLLGIWRLGEVLHQSETNELSLAQPADSNGSPRWDYVVKRALLSNDLAEAKRQIERCIAAAAHTMHPHVVAVLDGSLEGQSPYVVMPRLEGGTMSERLEQERALALPVILWWTRQIAQALTAVHASGWVHQDIKPDNIIVAPRGHVTLIDFGFAARAGESSPSAFRGTPAYTAPESLTSPTSAQPASDIFSLGKILWNSMTYLADTPDRLLAPVAELIETMLDDDPKQRPTAESVSKQLLRLEIESLGCHIGPMQRAA